MPDLDRASDRAAARIDDSDADTVPDTVDLDDDNDGVLDVLELAADGADRDTDADGVPDRLDLDSDNDGLPDWQESGAVFTVNLSETVLEGARLVGEVGANGYLDDFERGVDTGLPRFELSNIDAAAESGRGTLPDMLDLDADNDGIPDLVEAGVAPRYDADGDGRIDTSLGAVGADGIADSVQVLDDRSCCDVTGDGREDPLPPNTDLAGLPDPLDADSDDDGVSDLVEAGGTDVDGDGRVDDFLDIDGGPDGLDDGYALVPLVDTDIDGNGLIDRLDPGAVGSPDGSAGEPEAVAQPSPGTLIADDDGVSVSLADAVPGEGAVLTGLDASGCSIVAGTSGAAGADAVLVGLALLAVAALGGRRVAASGRGRVRCARFRPE